METGRVQELEGEHNPPTFQTIEAFFLSHDHGNRRDPDLRQRLGHFLF